MFGDSSRGEEGLTECEEDVGSVGRLERGLSWTW